MPEHSSTRRILPRCAPNHIGHRPRTGGRALSRRPAAALLPDSGIGARCRGRDARNDACGHRRRATGGHADRSAQETASHAPESTAIPDIFEARNDLRRSGRVTIARWLRSTRRVDDMLSARIASVSSEILSRRADSNCRPAVYETVVGSTSKFRRVHSLGFLCQRVPARTVAARLSAVKSAVSLDPRHVPETAARLGREPEVRIPAVDPFETSLPKAADLQSPPSPRRASHEFPLNFDYLFLNKRPFPRRVSCPFCSAGSREADPLLHGAVAVGSMNRSRRATKFISSPRATRARCGSVPRRSRRVAT